MADAIAGGAEEVDARRGSGHGLRDARPRRGDGRDVVQAIGRDIHDKRTNRATVVTISRAVAAAAGDDQRGDEESTERVDPAAPGRHGANVAQGRPVRNSPRSPPLSLDVALDARGRLLSYDVARTPESRRNCRDEVKGRKR